MPEHRNIADLVYAYQPRAISPAEWQVVRPGQVPCSGVAVCAFGSL